METSTINQIIETSGLLVTAGVVLIFYLKAIKFRSTVHREIALLKDCYFYRAVIERYKNLVLEDKGSSHINILSEEVENEYGFKHSRFSQPKMITNRLKELQNKDETITEFLEKIKI
jgi:hypothetical protein